MRDVAAAKSPEAPRHLVAAAIFCLWALVLAPSVGAIRANAEELSARPVRDSSSSIAPDRNATTRASTLPAAKKMLFWSFPEQAIAFKSFDRLYASRPVPHGKPVKTLPKGSPLYVRYPADGAMSDVDMFMRKNRVFGLLVLQDGRVRIEKYAHGLRPTDRWTSFSVVKSLTSTLVGAALKEGKIKNLDEPVTAYVPALKGSGYEGVTIRQALDMSTGVRWDENYLDPASDTNATVRVLAEQRSGGLLAHIATSPRAWKPDSKFDYNSGASHVLGQVVAGATGKHLADYLSEKIWQPAGAEADAAWTSDGPDGQAFGGCCLNARLRDFGRFGLFALNGFRGQNGQEIVPDGWMTSIRNGSPATKRYAHQWWLVSDDAYAAVGVFGQEIYIKPDQKLVVVLLSAWPTPVDPAYSQRAAAFIQAVGTTVDKR